MASPIALAKTGITKIKSAAKSFGQAVAGAVGSLSSKIASSPRMQAAWLWTKNAGGKLLTTAKSCGTAVADAVDSVSSKIKPIAKDAWDSIKSVAADLAKQALSALKQVPLTIARAVDTNVKAKHILISGAVAIALSLTPFTAFVAPVAWGVFGGLCGAKLLARVILTIHATREREQGPEAANNTRNTERARPQERDLSNERNVDRAVSKPLPLTPPEKTASDLRAIYNAYNDFRTQTHAAYPNVDLTKERPLERFKARLRELDVDFASLSQTLQRPDAENLLSAAGFRKPEEQRVVHYAIVAVAAERRLSTTKQQELPNSQQDLRDRRRSQTRARATISMSGP